MPSCKQKTIIKSFRLRIQNKFRNVAEETENVTSLLQSCVSQFGDRVKELLQIDDESFLTLYEKLNHDFESYQETLCLIQTSVETLIEDDTDDNEDLHEVYVEETKSCVSGDGSLQRLTSPIQHDYPTNNFSMVSEDLSSTCGNTQSFNVQYKQSLLPSTCENTPSVDKQHKQSKDESQVELHAQIFNSNSVLTDSCSSVSLSNKNLVCPSEALQKHSVPSLKTESFKSVSQGSCYRSLSSNFSDLCNHIDASPNETNSQHVDLLENESHFLSSFHTEPKCIEPSVSSLSIIIPSSISATLTHVIDPGDFWMQLENSYGFELNFPVSDYVSTNHPTYVKKGSFYLAPFKTTPFYHRAEALNNSDSEDEEVKVFFIDHGSTQNVFLRDLRLLPWAAYDIPKQAIRCYLYGISPVKSFWTPESIKKLKEFQNFCVETVVKLQNGDKYGVQLIAKVEAVLNDDYSVDIAQLLCLDGFAIQNEQMFESNQVVECNRVEGHVLRKDPDLCSDSATFCSNDNRISCDSGVSVTSIHRHNSRSADVDFSSDSLNNCSNSHPSVSKQTLVKEAKINYENRAEFFVQSGFKTQTIDLISFDSWEGLNKSLGNSNEKSKCIIVDNNYREDFNSIALHLTVPVPSLSFVEKGMMLVMLSDIVTPSEFYVNMAMENILSLDELREQMTSAYSSDIHSSIAVGDLRENMFCAGRFDKDMNWYRVKILNVLSWVEGNVLVQYVDYGNKAVMKCDSLRPLKPKFAKHPSFAIRCSLAGVTPKISSDIKDMVQGSSWSEAAMIEFKRLTSSERCLTAQICVEVYNLECEPLQVLLWDTEGTEDVLINSALAVSGVANFDSSILSRNFPEIKSEEHRINNLNYWDPMSEEYNNIENSYGVNTDDLETAVSGQKFNDDNYTCKYFALRGHCPRGSNCSYLHIPLAESGVTRDQEEVYSLDTMPLIPKSVCHLLIEVSCVVSPTQFYIVLPFGNKSVDEIDSLVNRGTSFETLLNQAPKALFSAMSDYYSTAPFKENTKVALACGNIVVAKRHLDEKWHRGRIIDATDVAGPAKIFFVDFGNQEWVPRKLIRDILPEYLHTPFQAIECSLFDIEPVNYEKGASWSRSAINCFMHLVAGEVLLAEISNRLGKILHLTLLKTCKENLHKTSISDRLVSAGYAQYRHPVSKSYQKQESLFVPG